MRDGEGGKAKFRNAESFDCGTLGTGFETNSSNSEQTTPGLVNLAPAVAHHLCLS